MKTLLKTRFAGVCAGLLFAVSLFSVAANAAEPKPIITISVSSYDKLMEAGKVLAKLVDQGDAFEMVQSNFGTLAGVDGSKPIGIMLYATDDEFLPVAFVPVSDLEKLSGQFPIIDAYLGELKSTGKGKYSIPMGAENMILEQKKNWLVLYPEAYPKLAVDDPAKLLNGLDKKYLLSLQVDLENVPKETVLMLLGPLEMIASMSNPNAPAQFASLRETIEMLLDEGKWLLEGINVDSKTGDISVHVAMEVKPDGTLAKAIQYTKDGKTAFPGFFRPDQAVAGVGIGLIPDAQKETQIDMVKSYFEGALEGVENDLEGEELELVKGILDSLEQVAVATIESGKTDFAATWKTSGEIFFAGHIAEGDLLGDVLKKTAAGITDANPDVKDLLKLEYTSFEGYKFSTLTFPLVLLESIVPNAEELPEHLSEMSVNILLGIKDDAICGVVGTDGTKLEAILKKVITDSKTPAALPKRSFVFSLPLAAGALKATGLLPKEPVVDAVIASLTKAPKEAVVTIDNDAVSASTGLTSTADFAISGSIISSVAKAVEAAKDAQMQSSLDSDPFGNSKDKGDKPKAKTKDFDF